MPITRVFDRSRWTSLVASFLSAAMLCGVIAYWAMILSAPRIAIAPADSLIDRGAPSDLGPAQRLFGQIAGIAASAPNSAASNITVIGIVASTRNGSAILAIDGKPSRFVGVGEEVEPGLKLTSVSAREVVLERNGVELRLAAPAGPDLEVLTRGADPAGADATAPAGTAAPAPTVSPAVAAQPSAVVAQPPAVAAQPAAVTAPAPVPSVSVRGLPAATPGQGPAALTPGTSSIMPASTVLRRKLQRSGAESSGNDE